MLTPKWRAEPPRKEPGARYPACQVCTKTWYGQVVVHGNDDAQAAALADKITNFLNADAELHHEPRP